MSKPKILLYANVFDTVVGQSIPYMDFFSKFGDVILITSEMNMEWAIETGDVLALPGGMDINSLRYNFAPGFNSKLVNGHYEFLDMKLLKPWIETGKPIIGICRGMQTLNVILGGTLHRHIDGHVQDDKKGRAYTPDAIFTIWPELKIHEVNSFHHQGVAKVAPGMEVLAWGNLFRGCPSLSSKNMYYNKRWLQKEKWEDNKKKVDIVQSREPYPMVPEIIRHKTKPYIAFQYHPEEFNDSLATSLINDTLKQYAIQQTKEWAGEITPIAQEEAFLIKK